MRTIIMMSIFGVAIFAWFVTLSRMSRKFARDKQAEGTWNADGPLRPTSPPPGFLRAPRGQIFRDWVRKNSKQWYGHRDARPVAMSQKPQKERKED